MRLECVCFRFRVRTRQINGSLNRSLLRAIRLYCDDYYGIVNDSNDNKLQLVASVVTRIQLARRSDCNFAGQTDITLPSADSIKVIVVVVVVAVSVVSYLWSFALLYRASTRSLFASFSVYCISKLLSAISRNYSPETTSQR